MENWKNKKQKLAKNQENLRNGSRSFNTVSYRKGMRVSWQCCLAGSSITAPRILIFWGVPNLHFI